MSPWAHQAPSPCPFAEPKIADLNCVEPQEITLNYERLRRVGEKIRSSHFLASYGEAKACYTMR